MDEFFAAPFPKSDDINASTLASIFDDRTNSYKFLFFLALLDKAAFIDGSDTSLELDEIIVDMLVLAWYPHVYSRLSFGKLDKVAQELDHVVASTNTQHTSIHPWDKSAIRRLIVGTARSTNLKKFVPFRLIRPFFPETRGMKKDSEVNGRVAEMSSEYFPSGRAPYKFNESRTSIILHPSWHKYFCENLAVLRGWACWNFLQYMQQCNPNVPAVASKLFPPAQRSSLVSQAKFWSIVLANREFRCIYSGTLVTSADFALDHFIPWSFVVHDQLWNLIPTSKSVNSRKSDHLPSLSYLDSFITAQHEALTLSNKLLPVKTWDDLASCFIADLKLPNYAALFDREQLDKAYRSGVCPLLQLAALNGFSESWSYHE